VPCHRPFLCRSGLFQNLRDGAPILEEMPGHSRDAAGFSRLGPQLSQFFAELLSFSFETLKLVLHARNGYGTEG